MMLICDTSMAAVDAGSVICPGCHQTLFEIADGLDVLPDRHYRCPTKVLDGRGGYRMAVAAGSGATSAALCRMTADDLSGAILRTQHFAAVLARHIDDA